MLTRRDVFRMVPAAFLVRAAKAADGPDFEKIDTHTHIHRDAPAVFASLKESGWSGLDLVVCPTDLSCEQSCEDYATLPVTEAAVDCAADAETCQATGACWDLLGL